MAKGGKTTQKTNEVQKVELPAWMTQAGQSLFNDARATAQANPVTAYGGQMTPDLAANQAQASQMARDGADAGTGDIAAARWLTGNAATGRARDMRAGTFDAAAAARYANPYLEQVQGRTLDEMGRQNKMERDSLGDNFAAGKAFGGTRHAVLEGEMRKGQQSNMLDYLSRSNADAYESAAGRFEADRQARMAAQGTNIANDNAALDRSLAAGGQFGNLGQADANLRSQSIMDMLRTGGVEQETQGAARDAAYREFLRLQTAPLEQQATLMSILAGTPRDTVATTNGTTTQRQSGGWLNSILGGAQIAASVFSDRRLKRDAQLIAVLPNGIGVYRFRYLWDAVRHHVGVMADEVARLAPHALGPLVFGFKTVDYSKLGATR